MSARKADATVKAKVASGDPSSRKGKKTQKSGIVGWVVRLAIVGCVVWLFVDELMNSQQGDDAVEGGAEATIAQKSAPVTPKDNRALPAAAAPGGGANSPPTTTTSSSTTTPTSAEPSTPPAGESALPSEPKLVPESAPESPPEIDKPQLKPELPPEPQAQPKLEPVLGEQQEPVPPQLPPLPPFQPPSALRDEPAPESRLGDPRQVLEALAIDPQRDYPPPDYFQGGRGLVYNCEKTHWACVNRASYFRCAENQKSLQLVGKASACVIKEIYYSPAHCARGQLQKIHRKAVAPECGSGGGG